MIRRALFPAVRIYRVKLPYHDPISMHAQPATIPGKTFVAPRPRRANALRIALMYQCVNMCFASLAAERH
jgi:hypothetical protein